MGLLRSAAQRPLPLGTLVLWTAVLWLAPLLVGLIGLGMFMAIGKTWADAGLGVWFVANALFFSPLFSWIGWLIALPMVALALQRGWFGWGPAAGIGAAAGAMAGAVADTEIALPFGLIAVLILRAVLGRALPLRP